MARTQREYHRQYENIVHHHQFQNREQRDKGQEKQEQDYKSFVGRSCQTYCKNHGGNCTAYSPKFGQHPAAVRLQAKYASPSNTSKLSRYAAVSA